MELLRNLGVTLVFLGVLVFVHELGHFLLAKLLNVKVLKFSIGFGPRIVAFTRGETEYRVGWIPLGGYVKMSGELPGEEVPDTDAQRSFLSQAPWKRALIVAAGPAFNLLFPILAYGLVFVGTQQEISSRIGSVEQGFPAAVARLEPGDVIVAVDGQPVQTFAQVQEALKGVFDKKVELSVERGGEVFTKPLVPRKAVDSNGIETSHRGMIGITPYAKAPLLGVPRGSVAEAAGLQSFDRVLSVNGEPVPDEVALKRALEKAQGSTMKVEVARLRPLDAPGVSAQAPETLTLTVERQPGAMYAALGAESAELYVYSVLPDSPLMKAGVQRGDRITSIDGQLLAESQVGMLNLLRERMDRPFELGWRSGTEEKKARLEFAEVQTRNVIGMKQTVRTLGLSGSIPLSQASEPTTVEVHRNVAQALAKAAQRTWADIATTAQMFGRLFLGKLPKDSIGSVGTLFKVASASAAMGWEVFVQSMAVVSISLGLVNLLPIPVLDGFALLTAFWEAVRRRPIPMRAREIANMVGLAVLFLLMALAITNDIRNW